MFRRDFGLVVCRGFSVNCSESERYIGVRFYVDGQDLVVNSYPVGGRFGECCYHDPGLLSWVAKVLRDYVPVRSELLEGLVFEKGDSSEIAC